METPIDSDDDGKKTERDEDQMPFFSCVSGLYRRYINFLTMRSIVHRSVPHCSGGNAGGGVLFDTPSVLEASSRGVGPASFGGASA
ncbi:hypothetical protein F0562_030677 [Nyssa sinensis]|uniref:Uncharacterized protein n=1 Tax=Nyssa sinensis TaxID=561372 RepID=A0A5J5AZ03_9ASTE|nr:hypothetical protein F0562_030677 [Nyssa sinensis]